MLRLTFFMYLLYMQPRFVGEAAGIAVLEDCTCPGRNCRCCVDINSNMGCLASANFALNINILANGRSVHKPKIHSGKFLICAPVFPPACWAFRRIHLGPDGAQVCSEVRIGPVPILKVPCLAYADGSLVASPNSY